jgi:hypothetical protein
MKEKPWLSGPKEILHHAMQLISYNNESNYRLAFLIIDNAVELIMKTYLSLPERVTGLKISRKDYDENTQSFPNLLRFLEKNAPEKVHGFDFNVIEWYHRIRNQLYHQGNGVTVEKEKVFQYLEIAKDLLRQLFGYELTHEEKSEYGMLIEFLQAWYEFEKLIIEIKVSELTEGVYTYVFQDLEDLLDYYLHIVGMNMNTELFVERSMLDWLYRTRIEILQGKVDLRTTIDRPMIDSLFSLIHKARMYMIENN